MALLCEYYLEELDSANIFIVTLAYSTSLFKAKILMELGFDPVLGIFNRVISPRDEVLCGLELLKPKIMIDFSQTKEV